MKRYVFWVSLLGLGIASTFYPNKLGSSLGNPGTELMYPDKAAHMRHLLAQYMLDADWIRVAQLESGRDLNSNVARQANNYFGLHRAAQRQTTAVGRYRQYAKFADMEACVADIRHWHDMSPRREGEPFERFLRRRGWNPFPKYYRTLKTVR